MNIFENSVVKEVWTYILDNVYVFGDLCYYDKMSKDVAKELGYSVETIGRCIRKLKKHNFLISTGKRNGYALIYRVNLNRVREIMNRK